MKVKELITTLQDCNPEHDIAITVQCPNEHIEICPIDEVDNEDVNGPVLIHIH